MNVDRTTSRYFELLESLGQAVIVTDSEGVISLWSSAAEALYGWRAEEVVGRNVLEVTPVEMSRAQGADILKSLGRGELWSGEFEVLTRNKTAATASVTDIPLLDESGAVAGVIGVSAASRAPTAPGPLLSRFVAACQTIWPGQVTSTIQVIPDASVPASEPHLIQLLAVLILLNSDALDRGSGIEISAGVPEASPFTDFALVSSSSSLYVRMDRRNEVPTYSVLRTLPLTAEPTKYASALVRMVGGMLIAGTAPDGLNAMHLLLPLDKAGAA
jgi:PAS domain S-box-containing protein